MSIEFSVIINFLLQRKALRIISGPVRIAIMIPKRYQSNRFFSHPDYTVGSGIAPNHALVALADFTAGRELRPAPKNYLIYLFIVTSHYLLCNHFTSFMTLNTSAAATTYSFFYENIGNVAIRCLAFLIISRIKGLELAIIISKGH